MICKVKVESVTVGVLHTFEFQFKSDESIFFCTTNSCLCF